MLALVISALISLGVISTPAEYQDGMAVQYQVEIEAQTGITNTDMTDL